MNYLNKMYGKSKQSAQPDAEKNPNRVSGGLRAQGVDRFTMVAEDGSNKEIPTLEYVRTLEEQVKKQRVTIENLNRKVTRQESAVEQLAASIRSRRG